MKKCIIATLLAAGFWAIATSAEAGNWMFRRSYYSHDPVQPVVISPYPVTGPVYTRPQGEYVRGGYRHLHGAIHIGGNTYDHYHMWDSWFQHGSQR
jgi:hypothetical protein